MNDALLKAYLAGTLPEKEERLVEAWFLNMRARNESSIEEDWNNYRHTDEGEGTSNRDLLKKTLHFILEHDRENDEPTREAIRLKIKSLSLSGEPGTAMLIKPLKRKENKEVRKAITWPSVLKWAAAVVVLFLTGYYAHYFLTSKARLAGSELMELKIKATMPGQKSTIYLGDGSKVILNAMSELVYPERFGPDSRKITLKGEAFFEVTKDPSRPFIVTAANITTTALGTSFNIRAYRKDKDVQVALVTGKVRVARIDSQKVAMPQEKIILLPGEAAHYTVTSGELEKGRFDARKALSWKENILYFDHTPLKEAFETLEKWYGMRFTVQGTAGKPLYLNGEFNNQTLKNVLEVLSYSNHFTYQIQEDEVVITLSAKP